MANLLPIEYKKKNRTDYLLRLSVVALCAVTFLILSDLVLLVPSYVRAFSQKSTAEEHLARIESGVKKDSGDMFVEQSPSARLAGLNEKLGLFLRVRKTTNASGVPTKGIREIVGIKPASLKIFSITYDKVSGRDRGGAGQEAGREKFVVSGIALNRDDLSRFVEDLREKTSFTKVELPISSYVKSTNISFSIVVERAVTMSNKKPS